MIELSEQQKKDAVECGEMATLGKNKDCFGCSCNVCVLNCRLSSLTKAAPEILDALKKLTAVAQEISIHGLAGVDPEQFVNALYAGKAVLDKVEGKK